MAVPAEPLRWSPPLLRAMPRSALSTWWRLPLFCRHWDKTEYLNGSEAEAHTPYGWYEKTTVCNLCGKTWYRYVDESEQ